MDISEKDRIIALERIFPGQSEMAQRMRDFDWTQAPLGMPETWPQNLRTALGICLTSRFPMHVWWGPSLTLLYNDAYIPFLGQGKHPALLGRSGREACAEIWDAIGPMVDRVFRDGAASSSEDIRLLFERDSPPEEAYATFSFSPIFGDGQDRSAPPRVDGMFCACLETTGRIVGNRRLETLRLERRELLARQVAVQEEERRRISRDLHDRTGQHLTGLLLGLDALRAAEPPGSETAAQAERLGRVAAEMSRDIHQVAWELRPPALDDLGLQPALATYVDEWARRHGITADFHGEGLEKGQVTPEVEITLYRVAQEALTNVSRHARARHVSVVAVLDRRRAEALFIVEDDGRGFDPEAVSDTAKRLGLRGMRERIALVEGTLEIEAQPGGGTTLTVRIPDALWVNKEHGG